MENDQRLTPLPGNISLQAGISDIPSTYSPFYDESLENKRSLRQYFNVIYKRLPIILALTILVTAAASFYSFRQPSVFMATTQLIIEPPKPQVTRKDAININFGNDANYYNTQLQLLKNPGLMKRVIIALGLYRDPNILNEQGQGFIAGLRSLFSGGKKPAEPDNALPVLSMSSPDEPKPGEVQLTPEENSRAESLAAALANSLTVEQQERTNIVNLKVESSNPVLAARIVDGVAKLFKDEDEERETSGAKKANADLKVSIENLRKTIAEDEDRQIAQMKSAQLALIGKGEELRASDLTTLQSTLRNAENETSKLQSQLSAAVAASGSGSILSVAEGNKAIENERSENIKRASEFEKRIDDIQKKINEANVELQALLVKYTEEHHLVIKARATVAELEAQKKRMEDEVSKKIKADNEKLVKNAEKEVLVGLRSQLASAQQRESRARTAFDQAMAKANVEGIDEAKLTTLKDQIKANRTLLDVYTQREKEQELGLSSDRPNNIKINSNAVVPTTPTGPNRPRNILIAFMISFAAGIGLAFLMDYLDDSVRTSDDISRHLGLPTLALIPHYAQTEKRKLLMGGKNGQSTLTPAALITMEERHSPMAEAYRHLRTSLLFSSAGKPPQVILVTSSQPSEGKTTTAINTAITLAQADAEVVIIDCDLRRPRLHSHFGLQNTQGLTNYLSGDKSTENMIRTYSDLPSLKIITSGPIPPNPAELLSSNEMRNLLQFLKGRFKHIIIDSPPAISFTDASILSTLVDGVVLVAMANRSSLHLMRQFKQRVSNIGARIYGVVLNGIKSGSMEYYYYGSGYYKYYNYRPSDDDSTPKMEEQPRGHETDV